MPIKGFPNPLKQYLDENIAFLTKPLLTKKSISLRSKALVLFYEHLLLRFRYVVKLLLSST